MKRGLIILEEQIPDDDCVGELSLQDHIERLLTATSEDICERFGALRVLAVASLEQ